MTDAEIQAFLKENGYPEHIWSKGRLGLKQRWEAFVDAVERGYPFHLEDYRNDLDIRALIGVLGLQADVAEADKRLRRLLVFTAEPIWECENPDAFWLFGYPRNAGPALLEDLRAEGFLD